MGDKFTTCADSESGVESHKVIIVASFISNVLVSVQRPTRLQYLYISSDMPPPHYDFLIKVRPIYYTKSFATDRRDIPCTAAFAHW